MQSLRNLGAVTLLACAPLAGCGGSSGGGIGPVTPPPTGGGVPEIAVSQVYTQLSFNSPTALHQAPGDASRWFVGEKSGFIRVFANNENSSSSEVFLDISAVVDARGEGGLLGFAFDPGFPVVAPEVYVAYTRAGPDASTPLVSHISRFTTDPAGTAVLPGSEEVILTVLQPETNHNGGDILFGPDGYLYSGFGDGGGSGDPLDYGQDNTNLHGSVIRIDIDGAAPYAIPADNPFAANSTCTQGFGGASCAEIYAWGLRNPWRLSFDDVTEKLWAGDVGQGDWEEVDVIQSGMNYGWNEREGAHCFEPATGCSEAFTDPITEYGRSLGRSVTGGYVYRGSQVQGLAGWYVFGDFGSGRLFAIPEDSAAGVTPEVLLDTPHAIVTFGEDNDGELYFMDFNVGTIHRVESAP